MSNPIQTKWNNIYQDESPGSRLVDRVLGENAHLLPTNGTALDLACGLAANGIFLAEKGLDVQAWDISDQVVRKLNEFAQQKDISLTASTQDLSTAVFPEAAFDVIVVAHFLERDLSDKIISALKPNGLLFCQTFTKDVTPTYTGPSNPDFRLAENELLQMYSGLRLVVYREESLLGDIQQGLRNEVLYIGRK